MLKSHVSILFVSWPRNCPALAPRSWWSMNSAVDSCSSVSRWLLAWRASRWPPPPWVSSCCWMTALWRHSALLPETASKCQHTTPTSTGFSSRLGHCTWHLFTGLGAIPWYSFSYWLGLKHQFASLPQVDPAVGNGESSDRKGQTPLWQKYEHEKSVVSPMTKKSHRNGKNKKHQSWKKLVS